MDAGNDIKNVGMLALALLGLSILVGVIFLVSGNFQDSLCAQATAGSQYDGTSCEYANGTDFASDPTSVVQNELVIAGVVTLLGFLSIIVIVAIARIIIRLSKGMGL